MQKKFISIFLAGITLLFAVGYTTNTATEPTTVTLTATPEALEAVKPYLLPDNNPIKAKLDKIFSTSRVTASSKALKAAGFIPLEDKEQDLIVAKHPEMPGYLIKLYYDNHAIKDRPGIPGEAQYWINRIVGTQRVKDSIKKHGYENIFVVPDKWIYALPEKPGPTCLNSAQCSPKHFILVSTELNLLSNKENQALYKQKMTPEILEALYTVMSESHLYDSVYIDNNVFTKEGKIAFIDTEDMDRKPILFNEMTPYFCPEMQLYWLKLLKERGATIPAKTSE